MTIVELIMTGCRVILLFFCVSVLMVYTGEAEKVYKLENPGQPGWGVWVFGIVAILGMVILT